MANELRHSDVGTALSKSEWEAVGGHIFNSQAAGDIMYASTTSQLTRLGIGSANQVLATNSGATAPEWVTSVASATLAATVTVIDSTDTSSYIAMFDSATGSLAAKTDAGITYNAGTGMLTATGFTGPLTGTLQTASQTNITAVGTIATGVWQGTAIASGYIAADAITGAKIADDAIDSEHYTDGSIDTAHLAADAVTGAKIADNAIDSEHYTDGSIDNAHLADNSVDSDNYVDGSIDTAHIADNQVTLAKMAGLVRGKIIYGDSSGDPAALTVGSSGQYLTSDGTDISWGSISSAAVTALNNATADELVTVGSTTTQLDAEANLTYASDVLTTASSSAGLPRIDITNTHAGATAGEIRFNKDSASGADSDTMGAISWYGTDASNNTHQQLVYIDTIITDSAHGSEAASLRFYVAENDGTNTLGLQLAGQADADGEIDVTIGAGAASTATIAGTLTMGTTAALTNGGLVAVANQSNITGVGTITSGTWTGTAVASAYLDADTAHLSTTQTFTGAKTFTNTITVGVDDDGKDVKFFGESAGAYMEWDESEDQLRIMGASADATTSTGKLLLATSLTDINANDVIGKIEFQAPHEAGGTDAITIASAIEAVAQGTFSASVNSTDLVFKTGHSEAATEKFRFTSQGEIGIGGANYGTDGQVLTSGGAGAAPAWEDAGGGGTIELVADGIVLKGAPVYVTSDGKAKAVTGAWDYIREIPDKSGLQWGQLAAAYDPDAGVIMCATGVSGSVTYSSSMVEIMTISGRNTTLVNAEAGNSVTNVGQHPAVVYDTNVDMFVRFGTGAGNDGYVFGATSINNAANGEGPNTTSGSALEWDTDHAQQKAAAFHADRNKVYVCYEGSSNAGETQAFTTVGGTTRSVAADGSPVEFNSGNTGMIHTAYDPDNSKHLVVYQDEGNSNYGTARVGACAADGTISYGGSETVFSSATTKMETHGNGSITYDTNADRFLIIYQAANDIAYGIVADISGDSVSFGTAVPITAANAFGNRFRGQQFYEADDSKHTDTAGTYKPVGCEFSPDNNKICVMFTEEGADAFSGTATDNGTNGSLWVTTATIDNSDNSVTFTEPDMLYPGWVTQYDVALTYDTENNRMVVFFVEPIGTSCLMAFGDGTLATGFDNGYLDKFIGFAGTGTGTGSRYDDGDTVTISVTGHLNESQASLTVGQSYWLKANGYLSNNMVETSQTYRVWAGVATHASKLAVSTRIESHPEVGSLGGKGRT